MSIPVNPRIRARFDDVQRCYDRLAGLLAVDDARLVNVAPSVSGWSVAQHMVHLALANAHMLTAVQRIVARATPAERVGRPTFSGRIVLLMGDFPRGKGEAPARSVPPETVAREDLLSALERSRRILESTALVLPDVEFATWRVKHPVFGWLNARQWLRMLAIHADHHFAIIDDILAAPADAR